MILYPPRSFDANEWFILISILLLAAMIMLLPRRFSFLEWFFPYLFNVFLALTVDLVLAVPPIDLYDVGDTPKMESFDLIIYFTLYPLTGYIFLYSYDVLKLDKRRFSGFLLLWTLLTWGLEWASVAFGVFLYKGWILAYSGPIYLCVYWCNVHVLRMTRNYRGILHEGTADAGNGKKDGPAGNKTADSQAAALRRS